MAPNLIAYASKTGVTTEVAATLAKALATPCDLYDVQTDTLWPAGESTPRAHGMPDLATYRHIALGTAMYMGNPRKAMVDFCRLHAQVLSQKPLCLFTCGIGTQEEDGAYFRRVLPATVTKASRLYCHVGGEIRLYKLGLFERFAMRQYVKSGRPITGIDPKAITALQRELDGEEP